MKNVIVEHNESGEMLALTIPESIEPVICFTEFFRTGSALLFIALEDIETSEYSQDMKKGEVYYVPICYDEDMTAEEFGSETLTFTDGIYNREDAEEHSEWIDTVVEMHRKGEL